MRGGGWNCTAQLCRTAFRSSQVPDEASHRLGCRVVILQVSIADHDPAIKAASDHK